MIYLLCATMIWGLSFPLIGNYISGRIDSWFCVLFRAIVAFITLRLMSYKIVKENILTKTEKVKLMLIGIVQISIMYSLLYTAFIYLNVTEVLLFTIFTPIYISLINSIFCKKINYQELICVIVVIFGSFLLRYTQQDLQVLSKKITGFIIIQLCNAAFAFGQVAYKKININQKSNNQYLTSWMYLGAIIASCIMWLIQGDLNKLPTTSMQILILTYLGTFASGVGFYLWNKGAKQVNNAQLATMNNLVIPLGILIDAAIWQQKTNLQLTMLLIGTAAIILSITLSSITIRK